MTKIKIEAGRNYLLYLGGEKSIYGRYIKFNPVVTSLPSWAIEQLEGHVFAVLNERDLEIYCDRHPNQNEAEEMQFSRKDGSSWPAGIHVTKFNGSLREGEREYLLELLNRREAQAA